jgi:hypothetical protein
MSNWLKERLSEKSTWIGLLLGAVTALQPFVPEVANYANAIIPALGAIEVVRSEGA